MSEKVRPLPLSEHEKNAARQELAFYRKDLENLFGDDWGFHSGYARMIEEVARGKYTAKEAIALAKTKKAA